MNVSKKEKKVLSSDGKHYLSGVVYVPDRDIKGFFQVVHGMTEYIGRYDKFMREVAAEGYICFGYDHLGHGNTAMGEEELGYIAKRQGWELLCRDVALFSDAIISEYSNGKELPFYLMGHSMGSFIVRIAAERFVTPTKLIAMGTGGPNPAANAGLALISLIKLFKGDRYHSKLIDSIAFGNYDSRFSDSTPDCPKAWLTNDKSVRKKYMLDKFCTFGFSVSAMGDLIRLIKYSNRQKWYKAFPDELPILLISGEDDPVGGYGKGVKTVYKKLKKQTTKTSCILYEGARHEILNDFTYAQVKNDILEFIN